MRKKIFVNARPTHAYQKGRQGNVLFYCVQDRLVYYTIYCIEAEKYGIVTLALTLMYNHTHSLQQAATYPAFSRFNGTVEMLYSYEFKQSGGVSGPVFQRPFGWAQKIGDKAIRTCMAYIANNAKEKRLHRDVLDYRWNFIAYAKSDHPYSPPLVLRRASSRMRRATARIKWYRKHGRYLNHAVLNQLFEGLRQEEQEQLIDYIIYTYQVVDYQEAIRYWGSYEKMVEAFRISSGSEYDISEENEDDLPYREMIKEIQRLGYRATERHYLKESDHRFTNLFGRLLRLAPRWQVMRFLHLNRK
ncbi:MAG: hypothetical protein IJ578_06060 [Bacteroidales bacterium]|nr:hypothetical protein [Bacteroidales bacterium]